MAATRRIHHDQGKIQIALGLVKGYSIFEKYGRHPGINTSSDEDVWGSTGDYTGQPTGAGETMEISSSSDLDTLTSGSGAWTVEISNLLDTNKAKVDPIIVSLDGNPAVAGSWVSLGAVLYTRATRVRVLTSGSGGANAGIITLRHKTTTTNIFASMPVGSNSTSIAAYTVPLGFTLVMDDLLMQMARDVGAAGSANMTFRERKLGQVYQAILSPSITQEQDYVMPGSFTFPEMTDIKARIESVSANSTIISVEMSGELVDNDVLALADA